ncbi:type II/IV secretion system protein [Kineococcus sp. T13]|uniref:ATPase, T2SS/T4P/T4SS family n=1 Tax=Kineococcus vitellinus TaxID=2696565 RepID=UPI001411E19E|nr:type II/IV secretion system protein [Kineococcus vitellinus]
MTTLDAAPGAVPAQPGQPATQVRRRLGDVLVEKGLLLPEDLDVALAEQRNMEGPRRRLGQILVELGMVSESELAQCLAELLQLEHVDLSRLSLSPDVVRLLPRAVAERCRVLVLDKTPEYLLVAAADPTNVLALDDVKLYTRTPELHVVVAPDSQIRDHLARAWSLTEDTTQVSRMVEEASDDDDEDPLAALNGSVDDDAPIVKLVNRILSDAVRLRCSDIHLESQRDQLRVRFRIDGLLRDVMSAPKRVAPSVISRIKIISGLDISERRIPQDGRTRVTVDGAAIDCRVSTLPALHGEKVVIRLLTRGDDVPSLPSLGFEPEQLEVFEKALSVPQGLVLITGPTGSGKTNTLYAAIHATMSPEKNIITLEDPVEVQLPGITQVQVHAKVGMTFSAGLRSVLRQDPDIVLIGEVRDSETAELALKAAMTGHLVLTTLHTNSAVGALTRLVDMGAAPFLVASSLTAAIAQRLVRRPCESCADGYIPDDDVLALLGLTIEDILDATPLKGTGCPECGGTGYRGRTAVYEVLDVTPSMRKVLMSDATESALLAEAERIGMKTLRQSALAKAMRGETTFEEVVRVTAG